MQFKTHAALIEDTLRRCNVKQDEKVVFLTSNLHDPVSVLAYEEACRRVSDHVVSVRYFPREISDAHHMNDMLRATLSGADFVLDYRGGTFPTPFAQLTAHSHGLEEVLRSGTRWLDICLNEASQFRLYPSEELVADTIAGAAILAEANEIRLTSADGTDLTLRKDGRKGHRQTGFAEAPGIWDNFGFAMVACAPLEDSANGTMVLQAGDGLLQMGRPIREKVVLKIEGGKIVAIEGGETAQAIQQWMEAWKDPESFGVSHIGWGLHPNAVWTGHPRFTPADGESLRGSILLAFGSSTTDTPVFNSGIAGKRHARSHLDMPMLNHSFHLDGKTIVDNGAIAY